MIKLGDKIANVRDVTATPPAEWSLARRREYLDWTEQVVRGCRGVNPGLERYYDEVLQAGRIALED
jgi:guanosine-3',5'-bis(diphosphate) 3'-pyrophosphohydrolase